MIEVKAVVRWFAAIFTEPDGNGGKASFARVAGAYVIIKIVAFADAGKSSEMMWDMFMVLVGYQFLSKALNGLTPALIDLAKGYMDKHKKEN